MIEIVRSHELKFLSRLIRSHRIGPVVGGFGALANQTRVICCSAYGTFSAGFILDGERSFTSFFFLPDDDHLFFILHTKI